MYWLPLLSDILGKQPGIGMVSLYTEERILVGSCYWDQERKRRRLEKRGRKLEKLLSNMFTYEEKIELAREAADKWNENLKKVES